MTDPPRSPETEPSEEVAEAVRRFSLQWYGKRPFDFRVALFRLLSERERSARLAGFREGIEAAKAKVLKLGSCQCRTWDSREPDCVLSLIEAVDAMSLPEPGRE